MIFWGFQDAHFQGVKKIWRAFFLLSRFHLGSLAKASFSIPNLLDRTSPQFKNDHWFLLSWYVDAKPLLLSNDIMKINIVCIYVYIFIHISINTILTICLVSLAVIVLVILMSTSTMTAGKGRHTLMVTSATGPNRCRAITSFHSRSKGQVHPFQESTSRQKGLHPRKLTWIPKMMVWKRWFLLNKVIFGICQISGGLIIKQIRYISRRTRIFAM